MLKHTALVDDEQRLQEGTFSVTWVVEYVVAGYKDLSPSPSLTPVAHAAHFCFDQ